MSNPYNPSSQPLIVRKLLHDAARIEADFHEFKASFRQMLAFDRAEQALILQCHLVIEHYITAYLVAANPASPGIGDARLTFAQKLHLVDNPKANFHFLIPGIKAVNSIRNKIAHRLEYLPTPEDYLPIVDCVRTFLTAAGKSIPSGLDALSEFTELLCGFLHADTQSIQRHGGGAGLIGLLNWWQEEEA